VTRPRPLTASQLEALNFLTLPLAQRRVINFERIIANQPLHSWNTWRSLISRGLVSQERDWGPLRAERAYLSLTDAGREALADNLRAIES
jgi:hypothetical protein